MFTFELYQSNEKGQLGQLLETVENKGQDINFSELHFTGADVNRDFYYIVKEKQGNLEGVTYDTRSYLVKVHVSQDDSGYSIHTTTNISQDNQDVQDMIFVNTVDKTIDINLYKKDSQGNYLEGAIFELRNDLGEVIASEIRSLENGQLHFTGLTEGTYKLKEIKAPQGYVLSDVEYTIVVSDGDRYDSELSYRLFADQTEIKDNTILNEKIPPKEDEIVPPKEDITTTPKEDISPTTKVETNDPTSIIAYLTMVMSSLLGIIFLRKKREDK